MKRTSEKLVDIPAEITTDLPNMDLEYHWLPPSLTIHASRPNQSESTCQPVMRIFPVVLRKQRLILSTANINFI
jgi:hypothetical protein